jgi:hypothetical protein
MLFTCPTLSLARLQYNSVFVPHRGMREIFTDPLIAAPLASYVYHHVIASATMLADRLQVVTCIHAHNLLAVPGLSYLLHVRVHLGSALVDL